jgi:hypothetical protein
MSNDRMPGTRPERRQLFFVTNVIPVKSNNNVRNITF